MITYCQRQCKMQIYCEGRHAGDTPYIQLMELPWHVANIHRVFDYFVEVFLVGFTSRDDGGHGWGTSSSLGLELAFSWCNSYPRAVTPLKLTEYCQQPQVPIFKGQWHHANMHVFLKRTINKNASKSLQVMWSSKIS